MGLLWTIKISPCFFCIETFPCSMPALFPSGTLQAADVWASHAQRLGKAHLPKTMKSGSFPVGSYGFTLNNKNQSLFLLHRDFPMFNASSSKSNSSTQGTLHFTRQPRSCEVAPTLRQFHFQTLTSNASDSSSSPFTLQMFFKSCCSSSKWYETDGNQQNLWCFC